MRGPESTKQELIHVNALYTPTVLWNRLVMVLLLTKHSCAMIQWLYSDMASLTDLLGSWVVTV